MILEPHDDATLRELLTTNFNRLARDVTDATQIASIVEDFFTHTRRIMHDLSNAWNQKSRIFCLPDELLAAICAVLPLRDRITASHISRAWRHAALSFPAVWTDIEIFSRFSDPMAVIAMMFSRTGNAPISFFYDDVSGDPKGYPEILRAIKPHMHRISSISWWAVRYDGAGLPLAFTDPAPLIRSLTTNIPCHLSENFLGGQTGGLRTLHVPVLRLPAACPAVASVTNLYGASPTVMDDTETLRELFTLFPSLESLSLSSLREALTNHLPQGPAPASLKRLRLTTYEDVCDLAGRYAAWKTPSLTDVELIYQVPSPELSTPALRALFVDACEMKVILPNEAGDGTTISFGPSFHLRFARPAPDALAALLRMQTFERLRHADIDIRVLKPIVYQLPREMERITLHAHEVDYGREFGNLIPNAVNFVVYPWYAFDRLEALAAQCPNLVSLTVEMHPLDKAHPPAARHARDLLRTLALFDTRSLPDVHVRGFSEDVISEVQADPVEGTSPTRVVFDS